MSNSSSVVPNPGSNVSPPFRTWSVVHAARVAAAAAAAGNEFEGHINGVAGAGSGGVGPFQSHPYRRPLLIPNDDFPLRKTGKLK